MASIVILKDTLTHTLKKTRTVTVTLTSKSKQAQKQATRILADKVNKLISHKEAVK
ncbi:hypothetical protein KF7HA_02294 [Lactococcus lactis]|nr:hypothetical protein [Lactococcus lactis]